MIKPEAQPIRIRAHGLEMWQRIHIPSPWACRNWPIIGRGIPYRKWKYYLVEIIGEGYCTQAERDPFDVEHMALDYMACTYDKKPEDFYVEDVQWIRHR